MSTEQRELAGFETHPDPEIKDFNQQTPSSAPEMFYCWSSLGDLDGDLNQIPGLTSAGVAWRNPGDGFTAHVPNSQPLMIDSGGFQAATRWNGEEASERGLPGRFPYTPEELHEWSDEIGADIVAGMDVACEDAEQLFDATGWKKGYVYPGDYRDRMIESLENQKRQQKVYEAGEYNHEFMPVIQGNKLEDYENFIHLMQSEGLDQYDKLSIGTVCKRAGTDEILDVLQLVRDYYPDKYIHLFGATLNVWKDERFWGLFDSSDTAAWKFMSNNKVHSKELLREYQEKIDGVLDAFEKQGRLS